MIQLSELLKNLILGNIGDPASSQELIDAVTAGNNAIPDMTGQTGKFLSTNGTITLWAPGDGAGTVTSVATGTGLTGGPITATGTISLANTAVTAGAYTAANITIDAQGRITAAANGSAGANVTLSNLSGFTATRVPFFSSSSVLTDSADLVWDNTNKNLTIGAASVNNNPARYGLYVYAQDANGNMINERAAAAGSGLLVFRRAKGAPGALTAVTNNTTAPDQLGGIFAVGYDAATSAYPTSSADINFATAQTDNNIWSASNHGTQIRFSATETGSVTKKQIMAMGITSGKTALTWVNNAVSATFTIFANPSATHAITMPATQGAASTFLQNNGSGVLSWTAAADAALSNLASTAVNVSLLPGTNNTIDLGDGSHFYRRSYINALNYSNNTAQIDLANQKINTSAGDMIVKWNNSILETQANGIRFDDSGSNYVQIKAPSTVNTSYVVSMPDDQGAADTFLKNDGSGNLSWDTAGGGGGSVGANGDVQLSDGAGGFTNTGDAHISGKLYLDGELHNGPAQLVANFDSRILYYQGGSPAIDFGSNSKLYFTDGTPSYDWQAGKLYAGFGLDNLAIYVSVRKLLANDGTTEQLLWATPGELDFNGNIVTKIKSIATHQATAPTIMVNANAGTGGSATLAAGSTDTAGRIILTTVVDAITPDNAPGTQCTVTFNAPFAAAPSVTFTPNGATPDITSDVNPYQENSTTTFSIGFNGSNFTPGTYVYTFDYHVIGFN